MEDLGGLPEPKITGGHWPFSVHFSKMANQNIKQDTFKWPIKIHTDNIKNGQPTYKLLWKHVCLLGLLKELFLPASLFLLSPHGCLHPLPVSLSLSCLSLSVELHTHTHTEDRGSCVCCMYVCVCACMCMCICTHTLHNYAQTHTILDSATCCSNCWKNAFFFSLSASKLSCSLSGECCH